MSSQMDWISIEDRRASSRLLLEQAAERVGIAQLAHLLNEEPSTLRNQLAYRDRKRPSADLADLVWLLDEQYRHQKAGLCGEVVQRPPDMTPEEAFRALTAEVIVNGFVPKDRVLELNARMKSGGREPKDWERTGPQAVASGRGR